MAVTTSLATAVGEVRFLIGDDIIGTGVLPNGDNFSDAQIEHALTASGQVTKAAAARLAANLARRWAILPQTFTADGLTINRGDMAKKWSDLARELADDAAGGNFGSVELDRQDSYSMVADASGHELERDGAASYAEA